MKIIEIIPQLSSGGGERFTVDLCNELSERGHEVILCVLHTLRNGTDFYLPQVSKRVLVVSMHKKSGLDIGLFWRLYRFIKKEKPDIIHTHLRGIVYAYFAERFVVHGIHTVHSEASNEASEWLSRNIRKQLFGKGFVQPVTISEQSRKSFQEFYGYDAPLIFNGRNIPTDIIVSEKVKNELKCYQQTSNTRIIINLARVMEVKRQGLIARVCRRLYNEGFDFTILFIGRYDESSLIVNEIKEANCPVAHLLGERQNPLEYLKAADAYCLMSSYEGMPISLIEALGTGTIPICTPVGGIVDVIQNGINGFISPNISEEACYTTLKRFLELPDKDLKIMKQQALKSYQPFSMTECANNYVTLISKLLNKQS